MKVNGEGIVDDPKVVIKRFQLIEHGALEAVHAIVVHQTASKTVAGTFNSYLNPKNSSEATGAHFLIDRDGSIYQTASLKKRCYHVGKYIKSKCLQLTQENCRDAKSIMTSVTSWPAKVKQLDQLERSKGYPARYPLNSDSIGIEIVGAALTSDVYEELTMQQQASLKWLVAELSSYLRLSAEDVYRHPEVSYKNEGEAASAIWK